MTQKYPKLLEFDTKLSNHPPAFYGMLMAMPAVYDVASFGDERGAFCAPWSCTNLPSKEINLNPMQHNVSFSKRGTVRGMHWQVDKLLGKLVTCLQGKIIDAVVDIRKKSDTYGKVITIPLTGHNSIMSSQSLQCVWVPPGFAHGFCALEDDSIVSYLQSGEYDPTLERSFNALDTNMNIQWDLGQLKPIMSDKDQKAPSFESLSDKDLL